MNWLELLALFFDSDTEESPLRRILSALGLAPADTPGRPGAYEAQLVTYERQLTRRREPHPNDL